MLPLPIDPLLPEIVAAARSRRVFVLGAPPGAGKTTRVPRALLDAGFTARGEILVLQPRRLAARMSARRVAEELGEPVGRTVGYTVRFEDVSGTATRVRFVTEGVLTRRLLADPALRGVSVVLLDEFHERHLEGDVALALLRRLQGGGREDLVLGVMSATLDAAPVARFLGDAPVIVSEGRMHPVEIVHATRPDDAPLQDRVATALRLELEGGLDGDVLVFLPGAAEIRRTASACAALARRADLDVVSLHGDLSPQEQDRAVRPGPRPKVILSTNVAETSVTIEGVTRVVDSGLARIAAHAPWSGLPVLRLAKISRAACIQRAGRAGRVRPGRCVRLYTRHEFDTRPEFELPEVRRLDLAGAVLELAAAGHCDPRGFPWFEAPPENALTAAERLLERLGAVSTGGGRITAAGRRLAAIPAHPRLAALVEASARLGVAEEGCVAAAVLGERDVLTESRSAQDAEPVDSDVADRVARFLEAAHDGFGEGRLRMLGLDPSRIGAVDRARRQFSRWVAGRGERTPPPADWHSALGRAVLAAFPDRVARLRPLPRGGPGGRDAVEVVFGEQGGARALLSPSSGVHDATWVVAVDAEERTDARGTQTLVRMVSTVELDWLLEDHADFVVDARVVRWNADREVVEVVRRLSYDGLTLEETPDRARTDAVDAEASAVLAEQAVRTGWRNFVNADEADGWIERVRFARSISAPDAFPEVDDAFVRSALARASVGLRGFRELREAGVLDAVRGALDAAQRQRLDRLAPERVELPGGRRVRISYSGEAPSIASRLQDFFGMARGPTVGEGRVPVVLHLLAPNGRDVQVTRDLAGFWERHYPGIARELRRKYPRHRWPDDPLTAEPGGPLPRTR